MNIAEQFAGRPLPEPEEPTVGHNNPPEPTPYEQARDRIDDLWAEALQWLDGEEISNQSMADGLSNLLNMIREARKEADAARKEEARPFDKGKAEVQARYKPVLEKADRAAETAKQALTPWLDKLAAEKQAAADKALQEAQEQRRQAEEAVRASAGNLSERTEADEALKAAKKAEAVANKMGKDTAKSGTIGRSVSLRTTYKPVLVDAVAAAKHYWLTNREEMERFIMTLAARDVADGKRKIPGFEVQVTKTAV